MKEASVESVEFEGYTKTNDTEIQEVALIMGDPNPDATEGATSKHDETGDAADGEQAASSKETFLIPKGCGKEVTSTPQKSSSRRTGSHVKRQNSKGRVDTSYQLSPDLQAVNVDLLAKKYGGTETANSAAKVIQEFYRHWVLSRSFQRMRAYSERRKQSITRYSESLSVDKQSQNGVFNIENPVLIVDLNDNGSKDDSSYLQTKEDSSNLEIEVGHREKTSSFLKTMSRAKVVADEKGAVNRDGRKILLPSDTVFYQGGQREGKIEKEVMLGSSKLDEAFSQEGTKKEGREGQKEVNDNEQVPGRLRRSESTDSYEIIDGNLLRSLINLFVNLFIHYFIHSFIHLFNF